MLRRLRSQSGHNNRENSSIVKILKDVTEIKASVHQTTTLFSFDCLDKLANVSHKRYSGSDNEIDPRKITETAKRIKRLKTNHLPNEDLQTLVDNACIATKGNDNIVCSKTILDEEYQAMESMKMMVMQNGLLNTIPMSIFSHDSFMRTMDNWKAACIGSSTVLEEIHKAYTSLDNAVKKLPIGFLNAKTAVQDQAMQLMWQLQSDSKVNYASMEESFSYIKEFWNELAQLQMIAVSFRECMRNYDVDVRNQVVKYAKMLRDFILHHPYMAPFVNEDVIRKYLTLHEIENADSDSEEMNKESIPFPLTMINLMNATEFMDFKVQSIIFPTSSHEARVMHAICNNTLPSGMFAPPICLGTLQDGLNTIFLIADEPLLVMEKILTPNTFVNDKQKLHLVRDLSHFLEYLNTKMHTSIVCKIGHIALTRAGKISLLPEAYQFLKYLPINVRKERHPEFIPIDCLVPLHPDDLWSRNYNSVTVGWAVHLLFFGSKPPTLKDGLFPDIKANNDKNNTNCYIADLFARLCVPHSSVLATARPAYPNNYWSTLECYCIGAHPILPSIYSLPRDNLFGQIGEAGNSVGLKQFASSVASHVSLSDTLHLRQDRVYDIFHVIEKINESEDVLACCQGYVDPIEAQGFASGPGVDRQLTGKYFEMLLEHVVFTDVAGVYLLAPNNKECQKCKGLCKLHGKRETYVALARLLLSIPYYSCKFPGEIALTTFHQFINNKKNTMTARDAANTFPKLERYIPSHDNVCGDYIISDDGAILYKQPSDALIPPAVVTIPNSIDIDKLTNGAVRFKRIPIKSLWNVLAEFLEENWEQTEMFACIIREQMKVNGISSLANKWSTVWNAPTDIIRRQFCHVGDYISAKQLFDAITFEGFSEQDVVQLDIFKKVLTDDVNLRKIFIKAVSGTSVLIFDSVRSKIQVQLRAHPMTDDFNCAMMNNAVEYHTCLLQAIFPRFMDEEHLKLLISASDIDTFNTK